MTAPPLPEIPCLRVRLDYTQTDGLKGGNRLFFSYPGGAPSSANCATLAGDIATIWNTTLANQINADWSLTEVDVLDIATNSGLSGQWVGNDPGSIGGASLPAQCATNVEFGIARRYRGGKPRMFLPSANDAAKANGSTWTPTFIGDTNTQVEAFFAAINALTVGAVGALTHVNLSYYYRFTNVTNSSGRTRAAPSYRTVALVDTITGYSCKAEISSQKRRRTATSY